jgi:hypothetical protein
MGLFNTIKNAAKDVESEFVSGANSTGGKLGGIAKSVGAKPVAAVRSAVTAQHVMQGVGWLGNKVSTRNNDPEANKYPGKYNNR